MPVPLTHPGVYVQELQNPVRPIAGVATAVAAFVGAAPRGRTDDPVAVNSFSDYERTFGGLDDAFPLSLAVFLFFLNGGSAGLVVRTSDPSTSTAAVQLSPDIRLLASSPGAWGTHLTASVNTKDLLDPNVNRFNLAIADGETGNVENYRGVSLTKGTPTYLPTLLASSQLVVADPANTYQTVPAATKDPVPFSAPAPAPTTGGAATPPPATPAPAGAAGAPAATPAAAPAAPTSLGDEGAKTGIFALKKADIFNILCLPIDPGTTYSTQTLGDAVAFCVAQRAMLIVDPPSAWTNHPGQLDFQTATGSPALSPASPNAATYYPNLVVTDKLGTPKPVGPSGALAGVWAATDAARGVWKAPAGTAATISGVTDLQVHIDDGESGDLNPLAINCLRTLPSIGPVAWGARTTVGVDQLGDQWKYIPVRRTALFIEESLRRGTQWVVFEPNDEPLWSSIRLNVGAFMNGLFRQGAFQGSTPAEAYVVKCDKDNNPQNQVDLGIVTILVGFAPLKPAEFVIIQIQQQAGQA